MNKEYVFVGTAQLKTRDYINQLEKENKELKADKEVILSSMLRSMQRDRISSLGGNKDE